MSPTAQTELERAITQLDLEPAAGWEHYLTSMGDFGESVFLYDHENGRRLRVTVTASGDRRYATTVQV